MNLQLHCKMVFCLAKFLLLHLWSKAYWVEIQSPNRPVYLYWKTSNYSKADHGSRRNGFFPENIYLVSMRLDYPTWTFCYLCSLEKASGASKYYMKIIYTLFCSVLKTKWSCDWHVLFLLHILIKNM